MAAGCLGQRWGARQQATWTLRDERLHTELERLSRYQVATNRGAWGEETGRNLAHNLDGCLSVVVHVARMGGTL